MCKSFAQLSRVVKELVIKLDFTGFTRRCSFCSQMVRKIILLSYHLLQERDMFKYFCVSHSSKESWKLLILLHQKSRYWLKLLYLSPLARDLPNHMKKRYDGGKPRSENSAELLLLPTDLKKALSESFASIYT